MAVDCSWADAQLESDPLLSVALPTELRNRILESQGSEYLNALATASLVPRCTDRMLALYKSLVAELFAKWTSLEQLRSATQDVAVLSCLARILPFVPYLGMSVRDYISHSQLNKLLQENMHQVQHFDHETIRILLLAFFRLLSYDRRGFVEILKPVFFTSFFSHQSLPVRYLAILCFCEVMHFADALCEKLLSKYAGNDSAIGVWENEEIDYRLLKLHEERRWQQVEEDVCAKESTNSSNTHLISARFTDADLDARTANIAGILIPRSQTLQTQRTTFIKTHTAYQNLRSLGQTFCTNKPTLLVGSPDSGKSTLIQEAARLMNKGSTLVTLHLNEQTDAKSLLGLYASSSKGNSFIWHPGVLTKAVQEGRWILIEDIERAPSEVLGILRPLLEKQELFLPSQKQRIRPRDGFRILATITKKKDGKGFGAIRNSILSNGRLWNVIQTEDYPLHEVRDVILNRYPICKSVLDAILEAHKNIMRAYDTDARFRSSQSRFPSLRDLLKFSRRIAQRLASVNDDSTQVIFTDEILLDILKDGIDCYAAFQADNEVFQITAELLARCFNISHELMKYCLSNRPIKLQDTKLQVQIGRSHLPKVGTGQSRLQRSSSFALTHQAQRSIDALAAGISSSEPMLLVGETGVGKTTLVQQIAGMVGQKLTVINLSQQSEATDLLGGLKPVTTRSLIIPLIDQFSTLFDDTFSSSRNEKFQSAISKAVSKQNWVRLLLLWQEAFQLAEKALQPSVRSKMDEGSQATKRRKLDTPRYHLLRDRWKDFAVKSSQIKTQMDRSNTSHTFAFVEGRLVQAIRNGEWLLLDEINLASPDTLDHIIGLLHNGDDGKANLLLTEAGSVEMIEAHPNFRIFAAMNPATDTGKKDLAPGVRSRFTELLVSAGDNNLDDLVQIIETYLGSTLTTDKRAASDLAKAYLELQNLNSEHKLTDGAGEIPHFSIRSLVRCLLYVQQHSFNHGLRRAMHEGFAMSFFTALSKESEKLAFPRINIHLLSQVKNPNSFLQQQPKLNVQGDKFVAFQHHLVLKGPLTCDHQPHYIRTASVERNLINLARAASMRRFPILLQGPTSAGKTSMVEYLAKFSGNRFVRINNHEHTDLQEYLGNYSTGNDGRLEYKEGVLVEALREGHWIVLDELNLAPSDVLEALNRLLDDNRELLIPESQEVVRPHPNFMLFATQNPAGLYGGRKRFSRAFRNRFLELHFDDIPEDELEIILRERSQIPPSFCRQIVQVYKKLALQRQASRLFEQRNTFATLRDLFRWASRPVDDRQQLGFHGFMLLGERIRNSAERDFVRMTIEETLKIKLDDHQLYGPSVLTESLLSRSQAIVWTPAMRRLYVLVSTALQNNEPVLLVGETGCGKTQICQTVAQLFGRNLNIYNAHSNTESGDLIGSQRPIRHRAELVEDLIRDFTALSSPSLLDGMSDNPDIEELIATFNQMDTSHLDDQVVANTKNHIAAYQSLFAWVDGSLIRAMKSGDHFLLDEISLADDSVLERLNSLLEPSRTILLAEKGSMDNLVVAAPDFQFLATMNPGGDYGKRELSAALRNRLTEIWVPPLSDERDILPVVNVRLGHPNRHYASAMLEFSRWFVQTVQNSPNFYMPLRSLLAWADFVCRNQSLGSEAFTQGAAMVLIDSVGTNAIGSAAITTLTTKQIRDMCLQKLQSLVDENVTNIYETTPEFNLSAEILQVGAFTLSRGREGASIPELLFNIPTTLKSTLRIVRALQMSRPILLEGNPGVGKTAIVTALAQLVGKPFVRINLSDQTDLMDLFGADTPSENEKLGNFSWRDGPLLQAMQSGGWVLLDEMNLASQSVLEGLNACLDHRQEVYVAELDKTFKCHPDFVLFAAQNPHTQGGGRKGLPASFVNRFTVVYADSFNQSDLLQICEQRKGAVTQEQISAIISTISQCESKLSTSSAFNSGGPWELNLRDVNRWLDLSQQYPSLSPATHFGAIVSQRFRSVTAKSIMSEICEGNLKNSTASSLYQNLSNAEYQLGTAFLKRCPHFQGTTSRHLIPNHSLAYASSIISAINQKWPVIITGPSASGKSSMIRHLAALAGAKLIEFSMNTEVDTIDLIGGFEQHDLERDFQEIQSLVSGELSRVIAEECLLQSSHPDFMDSALESYARCVNPAIDLRDIAEIIRKHENLIPAIANMKEKLILLSEHDQVLSSRFVWNDGVLIDALKSGSWLVLDNANLCNSSVLDRLNSLLEPNGNLVISEQHNSTGQARVIRPHPNFRIFLVTDPKNGELSRAMRNRSLEVYLDGGPIEIEGFETPKYPTASNISRLRPFMQKRTSSFAIANFDSLEPYYDSLSLSDLLVLQNGPDKTAITEIDVRLALNQQKGPRKLRNTLMEKTIRSLLYASTSFLDVQPNVLLFNEPLNQLVPDELSHRQLQVMYRMQHLLAETAAISSQLATSISAIETTQESQLTILQKTSPERMRSVRGAREQYPPVYKFLKQAAHSLGLIFLSMCNTFQDENVAIYRNLAHFLKDIYLFFSQPHFRQEAFQAYLEIGHSLLREVASVSKSLEKEFSTALAELGKSIKLNTGHGLQRMWLSWKPVTATSKIQLQAQLAMEDLIGRFDNLCTRLPYARSDLASVRLRLVEAYSAVIIRKDAMDQIQILNDAINKLESSTDTVTSRYGHFAVSFEGVLRRLCFHGNDLSTHTAQVMILFSQQKDLFLPPLDKTFSPSGVLGRLSVMATQTSDAAIDNGLMPGKFPVQSLLVSLATNKEQPLSQLQYAQEELTHLLETIASHARHLTEDSLANIKTNVQMLLYHVMVSNQDHLPPQLQVALTEGFNDSFLDNFCNVDIEHFIQSQEETSNSFHGIYLTNLHPAMALLKLPTSQYVGSALALTAIGALKLLVPDKMFDPAILPSLLAERHNKRVSEAKERLCNHKRFQEKLTGQQTSTVIRMQESDLQQLGTAPAVPSVVRPDVSELESIQQEFTTLLRSIAKVDVQQLSGEIQTKEESLDVTASCRSIATILARLSTINRAYDDLIKPISWLLQCLDIGYSLLPIPSKSPDNPFTVSLFEHIPLLGAKLPDVETWVGSDIDSLHMHEHNALLWIKQLGLRRSVERSEKRENSRTMSGFVELADQYYLLWKSHLEKDQAKTEKESRYYAYRGEDEDVDDFGEREVSEIFPSYGEDESTSDIQDVKRFDSRRLALKFARAHQQLLDDQKNQDRLRAILLDAIGMLHSSKSDINLGQILPALFLEMEKELNSLQDEASQSSLNIYTQSAVRETKKLFELLHHIQSRFRQIAERWSEHAVPTEVLAHCNQMFNLLLNEPVAKLLTKTEKLFELVSQWQAVASRDWSVASLVEGLTTLIIHWRRLELSSWSGLLHTEFVKQDEDAKAWYFIAYEAVIYNSRLVVNQKDDILSYTRELARTLEEFLKTATLGQFTTRLLLLSTLCTTLEALAVRDQRLKTIQICVSHVIQHYKRYETQIKRQLEEGKLHLEKAINDQIQLASWKDTNVVSLRESSRRSHYKLFRIVKKYRALLNQPVQSLKADAVNYSTEITLNFGIPTLSSTSQSLSAATKFCSNHLKDWALRPNRLTDPAGATKAMVYAYKPIQNKFSVSEELRDTRISIMNTAESLRRQTPSIMNEDNASLVREMKQQKRRLFAETMKSLAKMGIRKNLATRELSDQGSTAEVLSKLSSIETSGNLNMISTTTDIFHEILDLIPVARFAMSDHSEDLTEGEVRRGVGLLEGLLSEIIRQRNSLGQESNSLSRLEGLVKLLTNLENSESNCIQHSPLNHESRLTYMRNRVSWLLEILETSIYILKLQATRAGFEAQDLFRSLEQRYLNLQHYAQQFREISVLPSKLCRADDVAMLKSFENYMISFNSELVSMAEKWPSFGYLLEQLKSWTRLDTASHPYANGVATITIADIDASCQRTSNTTFVALQRMTEVFGNLPSSSEDQSWLTKSSRTFADAMNILHIEKVIISIEEILDRVGKLGSADLPLGVALVSHTSPTLQQFILLCQHSYNLQLGIFLETCKLAEYLERSFINLAKEGFCTPPEPSDGQDQSGKVENGTGLGDGEGAEDISKDIGDDEDLSEFAKGGVENDEEKEKIEDSKNAADVGADDLEGQMGSGDERDSDNEESGNRSDDDSDQNMDEEADSVDELDPSTVDEKMWEDMQTEAEKEQKEMKSQKSKGRKTDEQAAKEEGERVDDDDAARESEEIQDQNDTDEDAEGKSKAEQENVDPYLQDEGALDLPEDMQLTGEEKDQGSEVSDDDFDQLSDVDVAPDLPEEVEKGSQISDEDSNENNEAAHSQENEITEDQQQQETEGSDDQVDAHRDTMNFDIDQNQAGESGVANQKHSDLDPADTDAHGENETSAAMTEDVARKGKSLDEQQSGAEAQSSVEEGVGHDNDRSQAGSDALKQLADVLEQYHKRREILTASEDRQRGRLDQDVDMTDADFEHLTEENQSSDAQALGAASGDQIQEVDLSKAIEDHNTKAEDELPMPDEKETVQDFDQETLADRFNRLQTQRSETPRSIGLNPITSEQRFNSESRYNAELDAMDEDEIPSASNVPDDDVRRLTDDNQIFTSLNDAVHLWSECTSRTHTLSLQLTEQLRLILHPTTATKLRGDFRTGKRLNIRRIIPYIASGYKRDKIWMRRSVPTKRNYQVMLAVDDSKSMSECGADILALETLCMLARSLSMLEVGDLCVVAFGGTDNHTKSTAKTDTVRVAHPFGEPFTSSISGPEVFTSFSFTQTNTDVKTLVSESISIFRDARLKSAAREASELWQLQLIISDGHCSDHESIRRLVRHAKEEKILIVFVIVDNHSVPPNPAEGRTEGIGTSIVDLKEAVFERRDPTDENSEMVVKTKRYLESFPFQYYVVVKDVVDLPGVLARVLKGWFESVMET